MRYYLFLLLCLSYTVDAQLWVPSRIADMPNAVSNNAVAGATVNGQYYMYSFGGIDTSKKYSGIVQNAYKWNKATDTWTTIPSLPDTLGKIASAVSTLKGKVYILGGYHVYANSSEKSSSRVHIFDPQTDTYLADGAPIPIPIDDHVQAVWRDSLIYVITGWSDVGNVGDVQIYNPSTNTWLQGTAVPNGLYQAFGSQGVIRNDTIYYYGGASAGSNFPATAILRRGVIDPQNPTSINWLSFSLNNTHPLYRMIGLADPNGQITFLGGSSVSYNYDGISYATNLGVPKANEQMVYDAATQSFGSDYSNEFPMDLRGYADFSSNTKYICGGMRDSQIVSNWAYRLDYVQGVNTSDWAKKISLKIYPNPSQGVVHIEMNHSFSEVKFSVISISQGVLKQGRLNEQKNIIGLGGLAKGVYFLVLEMDGQRLAEQISIL